MLLQNHQTSIAPGYTPQLVVSAGRIDVVYVPTAQLKAQQQAAELRQRVTTVRMPKFIRQADFKHVIRDNDDRVNALQAAMSFVGSYQPGQISLGTLGLVRPIYWAPLLMLWLNAVLSQLWCIFQVLPLR